MRFDWYAAGVESSPEHLINVLSSCYELADIQPAKPFKNYERAFECVRGDSTLFNVSYGGNTGSRTLVFATGDRAPELSQHLRENFTDHHLVRADVALDYCESGAWESLFGLSTETADLFRLKTEHRGDYHREEKGRTFYIGSRQSPLFNRIYEYGKKNGGNPDHVRSELEFKPKTEQARTAYAKATPEQMLHVSKWSSHYYRILTGTMGHAIAPAGTIRKQTDHEKRWANMLYQYGKVLERQLELLGGDYTQLGLMIAEQLQARSELAD